MDYKKLILTCTIVGSLALFLGLAVHGYEMGNRGSSGGLTVTGSVKKSVTSDLAKWNSAFTVRSGVENLKSMLIQSENSRAKIKKFITDLGIEEKSITFLPAQINQVYEQLPDYGMSQNIVGYNIVQSVKVESNDIDKIEELASKTKNMLDLGVVPDYQSTEYYYTKLNELRPQLFAEATKDAEVRATAMAKGTGARVGNLLSARTGVIQVMQPNSTEVSDYGTYDLFTKEKEISATVSVTFELK